MLGVFADYHNFTLALNDFTFLAHRLDRWSYLHCFNLQKVSIAAFLLLWVFFEYHAILSSRLLISPSDSAAGQVVRRQLYRHLIAGQNADKMHP